MLLSAFLRILDMTRGASVAILLVLLARLLLKKAPKVWAYSLWGAVLFRLLCPVRLELSWSVMPDIQPMAENYTLAGASVSPWEAGMAAYRAIGDALNGGLGVQHLPGVGVTVLWREVWVLLGQYLWLAGVLAMGTYGVRAYMRLRKRLVTASPLRENIYLADGIDSPFVLGLLRPRIYLPSSLGEQSYMVLHEQCHIRRGDHIAKALACLALGLHWFNPLVWFAFVMAERDMEMSCDEAVVRRMGEKILPEYGASLLHLATGKRDMGIPLAFGEGDPKGRIRNLSRWKRPTLAVTLAAGIGCVALVVCLITSPVAAEVDLSDVTAVTAGERAVSPQAQEELLALLNRHGKAVFPVGADDPNHLSVAVELCREGGGFYLLHHYPYNGISLRPWDDDRSVLTCFDLGGGAVETWKLDDGFDKAFASWCEKWME